MALSLTRRFRRRFGLCGLVAIILALVGQLALGAMVVCDGPGPSELAALDAATVLCQAGDAPGGGDRPAPHRAADYALCPLGVAMGQPAVIPVAEVFVSAPSLFIVRVADLLPGARAPPSHVDGIGYPRGPPGLV